MSKVICDVCGTAYPETATVCPICGSAKKSGDQTAAGNTPEAEQGASYTYVKGGRFSKSNVRRRNKGVRPQETRVTAAERKSQSEDDDKVNKGLVAVVIVLLLAIVAVLIYIGVKFFAPKPNIDVTPDPTPTTNVEPTPTGEPDPTEGPTDADISCTGLTLSMQSVSFTTVGGEYALIVTPMPENTTDTVTFVSADESIATVTADGVITAVGYGETTITITCGQIVQECKVTCISNFTFEFNTNPKWNDPVTGYADTTVTQGDTWKAYKGTLSVPADQITWISDDPTIAVVQNGIVTAINPGKTLIHAQYGGKTYTCIFRCKAAQTAGSDEYTSNPSDTPFTFRYAEGPNNDGKYDVTIHIGTPWTAYSTGIDPAAVAWSIKDTTIATVGADGVVTALAAGQTELYATYNGVTFTCIVRVAS